MASSDDDEHFVWTSASEDSEMAKEKKEVVNGHETDSNNKIAYTSKEFISDSCSSDENTPKKIRKIKRKSNSSPQNTPESSCDEKTIKKRLKTSRQSVSSPQNTPESSCDEKTIKKRLKINHQSDSSPQNTPESSSDEKTIKKHLKINHQSDSSAQNTPESSCDEKTIKKRLKINHQSDSSPQNTPESSSDEKTIKKRLKINHQSDSSPQKNSSSQGYESAGTGMKSKEKKHKSNRQSGSSPQKNFNSEGYESTNSSPDSKKKKHKINRQSDSSPQKNSISQGYESASSSMDSKRKHNKIHKPDTSSSAPMNISRRIQFEDEIDSDDAVETSTPQSSLMKQFLKTHPHLKELALQLDASATLTQDDETWIIKCPHDIDVMDLKDADISIDTKCKMKITNQTYQGTIEKGHERLAVLSSVKGNTSIINVPHHGSVYFRRRIPKPHFIEDNVIVDHHTFIPLPDTKCRHPLFGPDYKRAIKIPSSVKARLKEVAEIETEVLCTPKSEKKKKKKHKKERREVVEEAAEEVQEEVQEEAPAERPRRKRKHSAHEQRAPKTKKIKREPSAADAWDSAQAIEDNLFNF